MINFKMIKKIFISFMHYFLILAGLFMILGYFWIRFIRERIPKNIPFTLSFLGFLLLIYICIIYVYIIYTLLSKHNSNNFIIKKLLDIIYKPLELLDKSIKFHPVINPYYKNLVDTFPSRFGYLLKEPYYFYYAFAIIPRLILVTTLFVDTFYFHYLSNIYNVLFFGVFLLFRRYIKYSLKFEKEQIILEWELLFQYIVTPYIQGVLPSEIEGHPDYVDPNDPDYDDDIPPTMCLPLRIYIDFQCKYIVYNNHIFDVRISPTKKYDESFCKKYNISEKDWYKNKKYFKIYMNENEKDLEKIMEIPLLLEYYNYADNSEPHIKRLKVLIFGNYLLCWLYILILSYPTLPNNAIINKIELISNNIVLSTITISLLFIMGILAITYKISNVASIIKQDMARKEELNKITWIYLIIIIIITVIIT